MALQNSQYDALMRYYQRLQFRNKHEQDAHIAEAQAKIPRLAEIDREIASISVKKARILLGDKDNEDFDLNTQIQALSRERADLLKTHGYPEDYLKMHYTCPICQDTGMAVIFLEVGQDVHFEGAAIENAVNEGVRQGYTEGFLRKSVVGDPLIRENTKDNTPAVIHYSIVPGDQVKITMAPKGFGSENMSRVFMLKPADGIEGVKHAILTAVKDAGPNACPPMVVGVGIGGTFEKCALLAKQALTRPVDEHSDIPYVKDLEEEMLSKTRKRNIVQARQISMYMSRNLINCSLSAIGAETGGKDHATVLHACSTVTDLIATDKVFRQYVTDIEKVLVPRA